jgi:hypothetical protein
MATARPSSAATIAINRAPVLTLWAAVVAERLGFDRASSLTLGRAVAGLNAQSKGRALGIFKPSGARRKVRALAPGETLDVELLHRVIPAVRTPEGVRALEPGRRPAEPEAVERYLAGKFGPALGPARRAMATLAASYPPAVLAERAYALYEAFRPGVPAGQAGWGARGVLDLAKIRALAAG